MKEQKFGRTKIMCVQDGENTCELYSGVSLYYITTYVVACTVTSYNYTVCKLHNIIATT